MCRNQRESRDSKYIDIQLERGIIKWYEMRQNRGNPAAQNYRDSMSQPAAICCNPDAEAEKSRHFYIMGENHMNIISEKFKRVAGLLVAVTFILIALIFPSTAVQAKTAKAATTDVKVLMVLNDGTQVLWSEGATLPMSKMKGSYAVLLNAVPGMSYTFCNGPSMGGYHFEDEGDGDDVIFGIMTEPTNSKIIAAYQKDVLYNQYFTLLNTTSPLLTSAGDIDGLQNPIYDMYFVAFHEINANDVETGKRWSFNFKVDKTR